MPTSITDYYVPGAPPRTEEQQQLIDEYESVSRVTAELLSLISYHRNRAESRLRGLRAGNRVKPGELQKARESLEMLTRIQAAGRGETDG